jgi:subtilisin family serine protease
MNGAPSTEGSGRLVEAQQATVALPASHGNLVSVIIEPNESGSAHSLAGELARAGIVAVPEVADGFLRAQLTQQSIQQVAALASVGAIWVDHELSVRAAAALYTIRAAAITGAAAVETCEDVTWAVVDNGIDAAHPALHGSRVETRNYTDDAAGGGHGTHIAGIIAGHAPAHRFTGVAPRCRILNYKVLGSAPARPSVVIRALDDIAATNRRAGRLAIHGVNISLGYLNEEDFKLFAPGHSPLCQAVDRLVRSGVFVAVAAGDFGARVHLSDDGTPAPVHAVAAIADPGTAELAVTVGSVHAENPELYGVSVFSSKGPTGDGRHKPDLVAPGEGIWSCVPGGQYLEQSGTSQATAFVSGAAALLLHRFPQLRGQPQTVKEILLRSSRDLHRDRNFQGHGLLDVAAALESAGAVGGLAAGGHMFA